MTAHIEANKEEIAKVVLMPGDPLRAKMIAEEFLSDYKLVNTVRGMYAYTGTYKDIKITVMASGMGMPSIGIYSYELYKFYDVDTIIRIGTAGSYDENINVYDLFLVTESYSDSSFAYVQNKDTSKIKRSSDFVNNKIEEASLKLNKHLHKGMAYSSDVFYSEEASNKNCKVVEMESFALFHNAEILNKKAACLLTISNSFVNNIETTSLERQNNFKDMVEVALLAGISL